MTEDHTLIHPALPPSLCSITILIGTLAAVLALSGCAGLQLPWKKAKNLHGGYANGDKLVVILPEQGPVADAANAIRAGLRAAHGADDTTAKPTLKFIANDQPAKIAEVYGKAVGEGATQVIGPLLKPEVDTLVAGPPLKVPTLALNQTTDRGKTANNLYQFALDPETEATEVAHKAKAIGFTRALMLAPKDAADQRRAEAFRREWTKLGGTLVAEAPFNPAATNPAEPLGKILSKGAAEFLFLDADGDQARKVYPAIRSRAATLPVIAPAAVYSGAADAARDKDLDGLYFVASPWLLGLDAADDPLARSKLKRGTPYLDTSLGLRLYAMGIDAYRLAPRLKELAKQQATTFPGETGTLSIDGRGRVQRHLALAKFTQSGPQPATSIETAQPSTPAPTASAAKPQSETKAPRPEPASKSK
jgi:outer membrane PBP1 activator LpoA protein